MGSRFTFEKKKYVGLVSDQPNLKGQKEILGMWAMSTQDGEGPGWAVREFPS